MKPGIMRTLALLMALLLAIPLPTLAEVNEAVPDEAPFIELAAEEAVNSEAIEHMPEEISADIEPPAEEITLELGDDTAEDLPPEPDEPEPDEPELDGYAVEFSETPIPEETELWAEAILLPFEQAATFGGVTVTVTAEAGVFPAGAKLRVKSMSDAVIFEAVETAIGAEGAYAHYLYRVEVLDEGGNVILPDFERGVPVVRVEGLDLSADAGVMMYDEKERRVVELSATMGDGTMAFSLIDMAVFDIFTISALPEQAAGSAAVKSTASEEFQTSAEDLLDVLTLDEAQADEASEVGDEVPAEDAAQAEDVLESVPEEALNADLTMVVDATPVGVTFVCTPDNAELKVHPTVTGGVDTTTTIEVEPDNANTYKLKPGNYCYIATAEGYESFTDFLDVEAGSEDLTINVDLRRVGDEIGNLMTWDMLQMAIDDDANDGNILVLDMGINAYGFGEKLTIPEGRRITLDLKGNELSRGLYSPTDDGCVICVEGDLTLIDSTQGGGTITGGNNNQDGGGIVVTSTGCLTVKDVVITMNETAGKGGGVYIEPEGRFTMLSGNIESNTAQVGGGVYYTDPITLHGGSMGSNAPHDVYMEKPMRISGTVKIGNACIPESTEAYRFELAGPLSADSSIDMTLSTDSRPTGSVRVTHKLRDRGNGDSFRLDDNSGLDTIISDTGEVMLVTFAKVKLYADTNKEQMKSYTAPRGQSYVLPDNPFTGMSTPFAGWLMESDKTVRQPGDSVMVPESGDLVAIATWGTSWADLEASLNDAQNYGGEVKLTSNLKRKAGDEDVCLTIRRQKIKDDKGNEKDADVKITLDLAGYTLDGGGIGKKAVIYVEAGADLTVMDSTGKGMITGSAASAVVVNGGTFTLMTGGNITGNTADELGGGVRINSGTFVLNGGTITGNSVTGGKGGGVALVNGSFAMKSGTISKNTAQEGGGVAVSGGTVTLTGGTIEKNNADNGAGMSVYAYERFDMKGGAFRRNVATGKGGGLLLGN